MVIDAEKSGLLKKGDIIIEPTSGNTGVGIAQMAASRGYEMIITLPEKMSTEKQEVLRGLGSTVIRTPTEYARDHLYGYIGIAVTLKEKLGDRCHMLNQYVNTGNGVSHYAETG
jgi:cysteine synthase